MQAGRGTGRRLPLLTADNAILWFNHKRMLPDSKLSDYVGKNEKTKVGSLSRGRLRQYDVVCLLSLLEYTCV